MTVTTTAGKINASRATLNKLAVLAGTSAERYTRDGFLALAKEAEEIADQIHAALADIGYYDF